jgi:hypothetical protein
VSENRYKKAIDDMCNKQLKLTGTEMLEKAKASISDNIINQIDVMQQSENDFNDTVSGVERYKRSILRRVLEYSAAAAAVVLIAVNALSIKGENNINGNDNDSTSQIVTTSHNSLNNSVTTTVSIGIVTETVSSTTSTINKTTALTEDVISTSVSQIKTENNTIVDNNNSQTNEDSSQNDNISHSNEEPDFIPYNVFIKNDVIAQTVPPVITKDSHYYFGDLVTIYEIKDDMVRISENGKSPEMWTPISNTAEIINLEAKLKRNAKIRTIIWDNDTNEKVFTKTEDKSKNDIVTIYFMDEKWAKISIYDNEWLQVADLEITD